MQGPTLLLYEDIHWADDSLLDLLETFAARVREVPVLFLALARPELLTSGRAGAAACPPIRRCCSIRSPGATPELAGQLLAEVARREDRAAAIAETAEGNPLFIEELSACARRSDGDRARVAEQRPGDRRGPARRAARRLSAASSSTPRSSAASSGEERWSRWTPARTSGTVLGSLEDRDLIRREAVSRIAGDQQYGFKHGLIHDVAYGTLPRAARRERHAAVAAPRASTEVGQTHEALAHHWRKAGENELALEQSRAGGRPGGSRLGEGARGQALQRGAQARRPRATSARSDALRQQIVAVQARVTPARMSERRRLGQRRASTGSR